MNIREHLQQFLALPRVQAAIIALILLNAVTLGLETSAVVMSRFGALISTFDIIILALFTIEVALKLYAFGLRFWRDSWNIFDFLVVAVALIPASGPIAVLRVLRLLRLVRMVPKLRLIVEALLRAVPGIVSIFGLLLLVFYVFAIIATGLFADSHPEWFGSLGASLYSLFQVMTLESWSMGIARPIMDVHPWAWAFFIPFILVSTFTVLNLFIAIMVDAMQSIDEQQLHETEEHISSTLREENQHLHEEIGALSEQMANLQERLQKIQERLR